MQNKFEQLIELFINEDEKKAKELFHDIVVEKSRDIYAELIKEEDGIEDEAIEETDEDAVDEDHIEEDETEEELGGNETQDLINDIASDESGLANEEESDEEEIDELQDAIADLQQQFDEIVAINDLETGDEEEGDDELDLDSEIDPDIDAEEPVEEEQIVEYAEKAPTPVSTEEGSVNTASQKNGNNKPSTSAKAVISSGEEKGGATPKYTTQTDAADPKGSTMSKA
jgi:hypothetical protein